MNLLSLQHVFITVQKEHHICPPSLRANCFYPTKQRTEELQMASNEHLESSNGTNGAESLCSTQLNYIPASDKLIKRQINAAKK